MEGYQTYWQGFPQPLNAFGLSAVIAYAASGLLLMWWMTQRATRRQALLMGVALLIVIRGATGLERGEIALEVGIDRIVGDPLGSVGLAVRKFPIMWATDDYGTYYALDWQREPALSWNILGPFYFSSQLFYACMTIAAAAAAFQHRGSPLVWLTLAMLLVVVLLHTMVEVQARYHAPLVPFLISIGGLRVVEWLRPNPRTQSIRGRWRDATTAVEAGP